jgi:hypothetical protein
MTSNTEVYSEMLDLGREKMNEGDYLKLATFLKNLNNSKDENKIYNTTNVVIDSHIEFDTVSGKHFTIKITNARLDLVRGSEPNITTITGTVNDIPFQSDEIQFTRKWRRMIDSLGIKNIKRQTFDSGVDTYTKWGSFKTFVHELLVSELDGDEEDELFANDMYCVRVLFCINSLYEF